MAWKLFLKLVPFEEKEFIFHLIGMGSTQTAVHISINFVLTFIITFDILFYTKHRAELLASNYFYLNLRSFRVVSELFSSRSN